MVQKLRFRSPALKMKHPPERHGGDSDPSSPEKLSTVNADEEQSSSSSDSDSSEEDFFQLESIELGGTSTKPSTVPVFVDNEISVSAKFISRKPPPPARYDVPDPNRIPMSVFARNTATTSPKDWSVASNDSLFSIQMGNSSFSREQGMLLMGRSEDLGNFTSGPLEYLPPRPPRVAVEGKAKLVDMNEVKGEEVEEDGMKEKDNTSRQSDSSSTTSFGSFAFPILAGEGKSESMKVKSNKYEEHQTATLVNPLNVPETSPTPPLASAKSRWFPCFCWCPLCC